MRAETKRPYIKTSGGMIPIMHRICMSLGCSKVGGEKEKMQVQIGHICKCNWSVKKEA